MHAENSRSWLRRISAARRVCRTGAMASRGLVDAGYRLNGSRAGTGSRFVLDVSVDLSSGEFHAAASVFGRRHVSPSADELLMSRKHVLDRAHLWGALFQNTPGSDPDRNNSAGSSSRGCRRLIWQAISAAAQQGSTAPQVLSKPRHRLGPEVVTVRSWLTLSTSRHTVTHHSSLPLSNA